MILEEADAQNDRMGTIRASPERCLHETGKISITLQKIIFQTMDFKINNRKAQL